MIVAPIPELEFADFGKYRQGIKVERIDNHVKRISIEYGVLYILRALFTDIEKKYIYFKDDVHMHDGGRAIYSRLLAILLISEIIIAYNRM